MKFVLSRIEAIQMIFVVIGASMAALGFMILFVGCLATGATRRTIYRAWSSRVGGRISCAVVCINLYIYILLYYIILYFSLCLLHTFLISDGC